MLGPVLEQLRRDRARIDAALEVVEQADGVIADQLDRVRAVLGADAVPVPQEAVQSVTVTSRQDDTGDPGLASPPASAQRQEATKPTPEVERECAVCSRRFVPDPRARHRARYCGSTCKTVASNRAAKKRRQQANGAVDIAEESAPEPVTRVTTPEQPPAAPGPGNMKEVPAASGPPAVPSLPPVQAFATKRCPKCLDTFAVKGSHQRYCSNVCEAEAMKARAAVGLPPPGREPHGRNHAYRRA